jgi:hypothetical protein
MRSRWSRIPGSVPVGALTKLRWPKRFFTGTSVREGRRGDATRRRVRAENIVVDIAENLFCGSEFDVQLTEKSARQGRHADAESGDTMPGMFQEVECGYPV